MSKSVLISIRPQWCSMIANGKKTIEVRKTRPKLETPFKCYIYCTVNGPVIWTNEKPINGKVIGEFVCDNVTSLFNISTDPWERLSGDAHETGKKMVEHDALLSESELHSYANGRNCYGWHISALQIYDKPKELSEFKQCHKCPYGPIERCNEHEFSCDKTYSLNRPFQSWGYVEELL
ncbi:hypothetical protein [Oscillibacter sp.]|uniref:hypothetical protein n=1 Tax=Oscillibacter sp. TaxID=1945593 RepID=UPI00289FAFA0|nr:hypothetical protein [Oscillibacter sp.]